MVSCSSDGGLNIFVPTSRLEDYRLSGSINLGDLELPIGENSSTRRAVFCSDGSIKLCPKCASRLLLLLLLRLPSVLKIRCLLELDVIRESVGWNEVFFGEVLVDLSKIFFLEVLKFVCGFACILFFKIGFKALDSVCF